MKNGFLLTLILLLVMPAFTPWLPHGAAHALHDYQESHHQFNKANHDHVHATHDHDTETRAESHHTIILDYISYIEDYLHVDLQHQEQVTLTFSAQDNRDVDVIKHRDSTNHYHLAHIAQPRSPPDWRHYASRNTPLYLLTQRLRI